MDIYHSDIVDIDLNNGTIHRSFVQRIVGNGDVFANRFGVRIYRNGQPVNIAGATCIGYFIRWATGDTITINGGLVGGEEAYVTLPDACYAYDGAFTLAIKLVHENVTGTMRVIDGTVIKSMEGVPVDPGNQIPDLSEILAVIDRAETAAERISQLNIHTELIDGENYSIVVNDGGE